MSQMKALLTTVYGGGDEAVAAVERIGHDWRVQLEQAADEVERLRLAIRRLAEQDATLSVCDGNVTIDVDATLTPEEREAVDFAVAHGETVDASWRYTLRGLLERLGGSTNNAQK